MSSHESESRRRPPRHYLALAVRCPECAAEPGERCREGERELRGVHRRRDLAYNGAIPQA